MREITEILPGIWIIRDQLSLLNGGIVSSDGKAILIDPGASGDLAGLDAFAREVVGEPSVLVFTGDPQDISANEGLWSDAARISSSDFLSEDLPGVFGLPSLTIGGWEILALDGVNRPGVYNPNERVLFSGPLLGGEHIPMVLNGTEAYLASLVTIEKLDAKLVVPSVGAVIQGKREIRQRIERDRNYIYSLVRHVQTALANRISLDRALHAARITYEDYPFVDTHLDNVRAVWRDVAEANS